MNASPLVSIVIPTKNVAKIIGDCLQSIKDQTYKSIEVIIVDNNSTDTTLSVAKQYTPYVYTKGPERSAQRNYAVKKAHGSYVFIIDSDMQLSADVVSSCVKKMQQNPALKALVIPEESYGIGFWAQCKKLERSFYIGIDAIEAARFFTKDVYEEMKGYDTTLSGGEDYDLPNKIKFTYGKESVGRIDALIYHNEGHLQLMRSCKKKFYYAQFVDSYNKSQTDKKYVATPFSIVERYKLFFSQPDKLFKSPLVGIGMLYMKSMELGFGAVGYLLPKIGIKPIYPSS